MPNKKNNNSKKGFKKEELKGIRKSLVKQKKQKIEEIMKIKGESLKNFKDSSGDLSGY